MNRQGANGHGHSKSKARWPVDMPGTSLISACHFSLLGFTGEGPEIRQSENDQGPLAFFLQRQFDAEKPPAITSNAMHAIFRPFAIADRQYMASI